VHHRHILIFAALALIAACGQNPGDDDSVDAGSAQGGLELDPVSRPDIPGSAGGSYNVFIATAHVDINDLRAIGDAAPGDERTRVAQLSLGWNDESTPTSILFADAPLGLYSQVLGELTSYRITGTVKVSDTTYPFEIDDTPPSPLSIRTGLDGVVVVAGQTTQVDLVFRLGDVLNDINWADADVEDGTIVIDGSSTGINDLRDHMRELFEHDEF